MALETSRDLSIDASFEPLPLSTYQLRRLLEGACYLYYTSYTELFAIIAHSPMWKNPHLLRLLLPVHGWALHILNVIDNRIPRRFPLQNSTNGVNEHANNTTSGLAHGTWARQVIDSGIASGPQRCWAKLGQPWAVAFTGVWLAQNQAVTLTLSICHRALLSVRRPGL